MSQRLWMNPALAAPIAAVLYRRRDVGLDTGNRHVAAILKIPESRVRRAKEVYCWGRTMRLPIAKIRRDGGTQSRAEIPGDRVKLYAALMSDGNPLRPPTVFYDGENYWLADGFIRTTAALSIGMVEMEVDVQQGTQREAQLFSFGANSKHGTPPTQADVRRAILAMLNDPEWSKWSDREIARRVGCHQGTVGKYREEAICLNPTDSRRLAERNGTVYEVKTAKIGKTPRPERPRPNDTAPSSEISAEPPATAIQPTMKLAVTVIPKDQTTGQFIVKSGMDGQLADAALSRYEAEVSFYREIQPDIIKLKARIESAFSRYGAASAGELGPFAEAASAFLRAAAPDKWLPCMACRDDALMSTGQSVFGPCKSCNGFGFTLAS